jgi:molybdopterin-guanine dinucleotide biosynthesis protein A
MSNKIDLPIVIFAGGKSSRMGKDKSLLPFGGFDTLTEYQIDKWQKYSNRVFVSTKDKTKFDFSANFIIDIAETYSPLVGIKSILEYLDSSFFAISVDTPFISLDTLQILTKANNATTIATVAKTEYLEPLCAIYNRAILPTIEEAISKDIHKLNYILKDCKTVQMSSNEEFLNMNYQEDYDKALYLLEKNK